MPGVNVPVATVIVPAHEGLAAGVHKHYVSGVRPSSSVSRRNGSVLGPPG